MPSDDQNMEQTYPWIEVINAEPGEALGWYDLMNVLGRVTGRIFLVPHGVPEHMRVARASGLLHQELHKRDREHEEMWPGWAPVGGEG